jgi:hypothetical protein
MTSKKFSFIVLATVLLTGCQMAGETKSGWHLVPLKDESGAFPGKSVLQVNGEGLSRGLYQAVLQYHSKYEQTSGVEPHEIFVIITNRRKTEDYVLVSTPDNKSYKFQVYSGGLIFDMPDKSIGEEFSSIIKLVELMQEYGTLKFSQGSHYFTINTAGFSKE